MMAALIISACSPVVNDGEIGKKKLDIISKYGNPKSESNGYQSVGLKKEDKSKNIEKTLYWKTSSGHLYVYLAGESCVESIYFDDDVQF